ncbi:MAG: vitamin K epoxide reductase family protein [Planctomycetota bacterium]
MVAWRRNLVGGLLGVGLVLCGVLVVQGMTAARLPGCGEGGACADLTAGRWGWVGPVPVSVLGLMGYGLMCGCWLMRCWGWLRVAAVGAAGMGAWFVFVQAGLVGAWCGWCTAVHAVSFGVAGLALLERGATRKGLSVVLGLLGAGAVVLAQVSLEPGGVQDASAVDAVGGGEREDAAGRRVVRLLDGVGVEQAGGFGLVVGEQPMVGEASAELMVVKVVDYTCRECRAVSARLQELRRLAATEGLRVGEGVRPVEVALIVMHAPLSHRCNPYFSSTPERHAEACELARLALAVFRAERSGEIAAGSFVGVHGWLMERERTVAEARVEVERRVGGAVLSRFESDPWIDERLALGAEVLERSYETDAEGRLPQLYVGDLLLIGRPTVGQLRERLEEVLGGG